MWVYELTESNLTMSAARSRLGWLGVKDSLLANGQEPRVITKGGHFGDATHAADKNSGRVTRPGIRIYNVRVIVKNVIRVVQQCSL